MSSVIHIVHGLNSRLELCGQWVLDHLHISRVRENLKKSRKGGFTLVELMVVVAVIAILAAIAMPQFLSAADRARNAKETADIQIIKNATQLYMIVKIVSLKKCLFTLSFLVRCFQFVKNRQKFYLKILATAFDAAAFISLL